MGDVNLHFESNKSGTKSMRGKSPESIPLTWKKIARRNQFNRPPFKILFGSCEERRQNWALIDVDFFNIFIQQWYTIFNSMIRIESTQANFQFWSLMAWMRNSIVSELVNPILKNTCGS